MKMKSDSKSLVNTGNGTEDSRTGGHLQKVDAILKEAETVWAGANLPHISDGERRMVRQTAESAVTNPAHTADYVTACECLYLFRVIHRFANEQPAWAALTGDAFFSRFSHALIPIDNVSLIDRFSAYLKEDAKREGTGFDLKHFLTFIRDAAVETGI